MAQVLDLKNVVEDVVSSYERKIENISSLFENTYLILNEFQAPLLDIKQERDEVNTQLRDILARNEHLRKKDFDRMMQDIFSIQNERENELKNLLNNYLVEQKEMVNLLKNNLNRVRDSFTKCKGQGIKESDGMTNQILTQQDKRKQQVSSKLKEFQKEQREMTKRFLELLSKGRELRIRDLKSLLKEFKAQHKERLALREERKTETQKRREEVRNMLGEFKKKRLENNPVSIER